MGSPLCCNKDHVLNRTCRSSCWCFWFPQRAHNANPMLSQWESAGPSLIPSKRNSRAIKTFSCSFSSNAHKHFSDIAGFGFIRSVVGMESSRPYDIMETGRQASFYFLSKTKQIILFLFLFFFFCVGLLSREVLFVSERLSCLYPQPCFPAHGAKAMHLCHHLHMHRDIYIYIAKKFAVAGRSVHWRLRSVSSRSMLKLWRPIIDPSSFNPKIIHDIVLNFQRFETLASLTEKVAEITRKSKDKKRVQSYKAGSKLMTQWDGLHFIDRKLWNLITYSLPLRFNLREIILAVTGSSQRRKAWILNLSSLTFLDKSLRLII